jgi:hypothetical protein
MVLIQFPDRETEIKGLAILMSRFSGKVLRGGLHIVPEPALEALSLEKIPYTVKGPATFEKEMAALQPRDEWESRLLTVATDCGVALSNEAVSSEGLYD